MEFPGGPEGSGAMYQASKILAHQATHAFNKTHKPHYTLVTLHPSFVLGRSLVQHSAEEIDGINAFLWQSLQLETPFFPPAWVHVKDVAEAHLKVLELDIASGEEFVLSGHPFTWDDVATFVREKYPEVNTKLQGPFDPSITVDSSKAQKTLGFKWRTMEDMLVDVIEQQLSFTS